MADIFDNKVLCRKCDSEMKKSNVSKNGFTLRALVCPNAECREQIIHPVDEGDYNRFINLKNKQYIVKMRPVGNSHVVSIPKEIINFMNEQKKIMDEMVQLCMEDFNKLTLNFRQKARSFNSSFLEPNELKTQRERRL